MKQRTQFTRTIMITNRYIVLVVLLHLFSVISYYHQVNAKTYETDDAVIVDGEYHQMSKHSVFKFISIQQHIFYPNKGRTAHIQNVHKKAWTEFYYFENAVPIQILYFTVINCVLNSICFECRIQNLAFLEIPAFLFIAAGVLGPKWF